MSADRLHVSSEIESLQMAIVLQPDHGTERITLKRSDELLLLVFPFFKKENRLALKSPNAMNFDCDYLLSGPSKPQKLEKPVRTLVSNEQNRAVRSFHCETCPVTNFKV